LPPVTVPPTTLPPFPFDVPQVCKFGPGSRDIKTSTTQTKQVPGGSITITVTPCVAFRGESFTYTAALSGSLEARTASLPNPVELFPFTVWDPSLGWDLRSTSTDCGGPLLSSTNPDPPSRVWSGVSPYRGPVTGALVQDARVQVQSWWPHYEPNQSPLGGPPNGYVCVLHDNTDTFFDLPIVVIDANRPPGFPIS